MLCGLLLFGCVGVASAEDIESLEQKIVPESSVEVFIANDGSDFFIMSHARFCELVERNIIPGEADTSIYASPAGDWCASSWSYGSGYYYIRPECFAKLKADVFTATKNSKDIEENVNDLEKPEAKNIYIVQPGDSLWSIANQYRMAIDTLKNINNLSTDVVNPGTELIIENVH